MLDPATIKHLVFVAFVPCFVGGWVVVCLLLARFGGWNALAKRYRTSEAGTGQLFRFASLALGPGRMPVTYRGCVAIEIGERGLLIRVLPLFRFGHPPLLIPWRAIAGCQPDKFFFQPCTRLDLSDPSTRLLVPGAAGTAILDCWNRRALA